MLEQFDASRLEELAESLLADVITDLAADSAPCDGRTAAHEGAAERLLGPMVGSEPAELESAADSSRLERTCAAKDVEQTQQQQQQPLLDHNRIHYSNNSGATSTVSSELSLDFAGFDGIELDAGNKDHDEHVDADHDDIAHGNDDDDDDSTVYGTYDAMNNCITIHMLDDDANTNGTGVRDEEAASSPVYNSTQIVAQEHDYVSRTPASELSLVSPIPHSYLDDDAATDDDAAMRCDIPDLPASDGGYESLCSPTFSSSSADEADGFTDGTPSSTGVPGSAELSDMMMDFDDPFWSRSFQELFPSLM